MTTSTLLLPVSGEQDLADWAAVAFVASYSSPGTRQAYILATARHADGGQPPAVPGDAARTRRTTDH